MTALIDRLLWLAFLMLGFTLGAGYAALIAWAESIDKKRKAWLATLDDKAYRKYMETKQ